jgi:hypothetical protein
MRLNGFAIVTVIFIILAWFSWKDERLEDEKQIKRLVSSPAATVANPNRISNSNISEHANIEQTLRIVAAKYKKTDVNKDGLYNCIDAAVLFYKHYPDKSRVCIEINKNPKTGMHHLFNCVFTDGVWKAIEPQAYYTNKSNYLMWAVWGNQYDNTYNHDETEKWKVYAR